MAKLWLPLSAAPRHAVRDHREELMQRLRDINVSVPGAEALDLSHLRDLVEWQEEQAGVDARKALERPAHQPKGLPREQVIEGLREYFAYLRPRREGRKRLY